MDTLNINLFGVFSISGSRQPITQFRSNKIRALLAYLAMQANQPHSRHTIAALLWPEAADKQSRQNLRTSIYRLRSSLAEVFQSKQIDDVLVVTPQTIQLNTNAQPVINIDVAIFQGLIDTCKEHSHADLQDCQPCLERLAQAVNLYSDEFLTGFGLRDAPEFDDWILIQREMLHHQMLVACQQLADAYEKQTNYEQAHEYASRLLRLTPYQESSQRLVIRLLALQGLSEQALAQFAAYRQLLQDELGVEPQAETIGLVEQIRRGELRREATLSSNVLAQSPPSLRLNWAEIPLTGDFFGRAAELTQLQQWLVEERCRLVTILGMGGQGKTSLAAQLARTVADQFEVVVWRSLLNAPELDEILPDILQTLSGSPVFDYPDSLAKKLSLLLSHLRQKRCLLILDNLETIFESGLAEQYRPGYEAYGRLIETLAQQEHLSCLLLTSRERPQSRWLRRSNLPGIQSLALSGLDLGAVQQMLQAHNLTVGQSEASRLADCYSGNPLALNLVAQTIQDIYFGDIEVFLSEETLIFDDIRDVLDKQFDRLSPLEQDILLWLAISREPLSPPDLKDALVRPMRQQALLETLRSLERRSLMERSQTGFRLQNVVTEYLTNRLIKQINQEFETGQITWLNSHALIQAKAKTYVRQSQTRLILQPIAEHLTTYLGLAELDQICRRFLDQLRQSPLTPGYAAGNILNLLLHVALDLNGYDFSHLNVWQANLQGAMLPEVNFTQANLKTALFTDIFGAIYSVAVSPDGQLLAAGTSMGEVRLWHLADTQLVAVLTGHRDSVWVIAFSPDTLSGTGGQMLASGSTDTTIRLWQINRADPAETDQTQHVLLGHTNQLSALAFGPEAPAGSGEQILASGSTDGTLRLWDVATGNNLASWDNQAGSVNGVAFSPDGQRLASGSGDQTILIWDIPRGEVCLTLRGHTNMIESVAFSPDGQLLASGSADQTIRLWDANTGALLQTLTGHTHTVRLVAFSPDGQILASCSDDTTVRLWDISARADPDGIKRMPSSLAKIRAILHEHSHWVTSIAFSSDGQTLISGGEDRLIHLWNIHTGQVRHILQGYTNWIWSIAISPDGTTLASGAEDGKVRLWNVADGQVRQTLQSHRIVSVAFSPDGSLIAGPSHDTKIRLWNAHTGQLTHTLVGHTKWIRLVTFSPNGQLLASASGDYTVRLWDTGTGELYYTFLGHTSRARWVAFSPNTPQGSGEQLLASGSEDKTILMWDVQRKVLRQRLTGHTDWVNSVAFSPDGQLLASGSHDHTVRLWDVQTGQIQTILTDHTQPVRTVAFSPDGQILASCSHDQTVRLWDVQTKKTLHILRGHTGFVNDLVFSPTHQTLFSGSTDETIRVWDIQTGECLTTWRMPGPYEGMNISGITGISEAQRSALKALGAVEDT